MKACAILPVYDHGGTVRDVVKSLEPFGLHCYLVDDGSAAETSAVLDALARELPWVELIRLRVNLGKGAAVSRGLEAAAQGGYTHAVLLDADGQHAASDVPRLLDAAQRQPEAVVLGFPVFDDSAPAARRYGRLVSRFWAWIETLSFEIGDPLCGFRCVPIAPCLELLRRHRLGPRMDFDPEIAVRLAWEGVPIVNVPTHVRYFAAGISHFDPVRDNLRLSWLHTRLFLGMLVRLPRLLSRRLGRDAGARAPWHRSPERGSLLGLRLSVWLYRAIGRSLGAPLMEAIVAYFFATDRAGRRASARYLERVWSTPDGRATLQRRPDRWTVLQHYRAFGASILDRIELWLGRGVDFEFSFHGRQALQQALDGGRGVILLGSHLGTFDVPRGMAERGGVRVNILMYTRHAERINSIFRQLSPNLALRVIQADPGAIGSVFEIRRCIERGEFVAILGDRTPPHAAGRTRAVPFFGTPARFPEGPFLLADLLGCPVFFLVALRRGPRRYEAFAEPIECGESGGRDERVAQRMAVYVAQLERYCAQAPLQWFNFFDFWNDDAAERSRPSSPTR